jgi:outer membrane protein assembly factor BamB
MKTTVSNRCRSCIAVCLAGFVAVSMVLAVQAGRAADGNRITRRRSNDQHTRGPARKPGERKWKLPLPGGVPTSPALLAARYRIYVVTGDGRLVAITDTGSQGHIQWSAPSGGPSAPPHVARPEVSLHTSPVVARNGAARDGTAFVAGSVRSPQGFQKRHWVYSVSASGNVETPREYEEPVTFEPTVPDHLNCVFVVSGRWVEIVCPWHKEINKVRLPEIRALTTPVSIGPGGPSGALCVGAVAERTNLVVFVYLHNIFKPIFIPIGDRPTSGPSFANDGTIYVGAADGKLYALDGAGGTVRWAYQTGGPIHSSPAVGPDGTVYVGSDDGKVHALDPSGHVKWTRATKGLVRSSPAVGDNGVIYVGSDDGNVYAIYSDGRLKWIHSTKARVRSSPVIHNDGTIYVGSDDGCLYALASSSTGLAKSAWPCYRHDERHTGSVSLPLRRDRTGAGHRGRSWSRFRFEQIRPNRPVRLRPSARLEQAKPIRPSDPWRPPAEWEWPRPFKETPDRADRPRPFFERDRAAGVAKRFRRDKHHLLRPSRGGAPKHRQPMQNKGTAPRKPNQGKDKSVRGIKPHLGSR